VGTAGGPEAFDAAVAGMLDDARGWRLAEMRRRRGMTQEQVAARMGVSVARVSQIEGGDVSTQEVLNRFVTALGGTLKLIADFGDEQLKIALSGCTPTTADCAGVLRLCGKPEPRAASPSGTAPPSA
jgi:DNA-binding XRE family transcriptional regulator